MEEYIANIASLNKTTVVELDFNDYSPISFSFRNFSGFRSKYRQVIITGPGTFTTFKLTDMVILQKL